ncbi:glutathione biosynthesis bifunctional protein GshAB [Lactococcus hodotermopsidis]|uniref:Glutathione biosynthesis bifunctional protein GshAB n=1 Tax=Pseudolactococcus hodotermopsidis TaxID=2709157 RepID=A0A6A0BC17_9LACT|nr:bifunctional glutamate--cysteine ligase GshA/glutathione synthetase GshB [Lactococcus hodotermopsidis]GFH42223.1 glutathione biosynthesis bifunctional protein GshAB [Lactococcus hodotermopsidis]
MTNINFKQLLQNKMVHKHFSEMRLGLEKESQRVTLDGALATTNHPQILGNRRYHPYIQTDFSESQTELITPVTSSSKEALNYLAAIQEVTLRSMPTNELLWPLSMPPVLPDDECQIKIAQLDNFEDVLYRRYLAKTYGKRKQMVSGIHYNFEFTHDFLENAFAMQNSYTNFENFRDDVYLKVASNYLRHRYLIVYLFGAAPLAENGYFKSSDAQPTDFVRSIRSSQYGYTNHQDVTYSFKSVKRYIDGIYDLVDRGILSEEKEFYAPVRLRGGKKVADLARFGVQYLEIRNIDLNPFETYAISEAQIEFLHLFLMLMLYLPDDLLDNDEKIAIGNQMNDAVALETPLSRLGYETEARELFAQLKEMLQTINANENTFNLVQTFKDLLNHPENTPAGKLTKQLESQTNTEIAVKLAKHYHQKAWKKSYQLAGFNDMALSTQIILFDAIQAGIEVEILDKNEQFIKLTFGKHIEYVKNANMTSQDSYIVPLIMANKTVTKKILAKHGFPVPAGREYGAINDALADFSYFEGKAIVIKPKSSNYGIGISIFKNGASLIAYQTALNIAFSEDSDIIIEPFITGTKYRFFVINGKTKAVLLRVPANVIGDGKRTISELVALKNQNSLRGLNHRAPLEKISLGKIEQLMLKAQGLTPDSLLSDGKVAYLRENSNISTGGDSIDVTDSMPDSYKQQAENAVKALGAMICGIDLIIPDKNVADNFSIIGANFNPAMYMHIYPFSGQGRRLTMDVLRLLFPELS